MKIEQILQDAVVLIEQIGVYASNIIATLPEQNQLQLLSQLQTLEDLADNTLSNDQLINLAESIHLMVEDEPLLSSLLLPANYDSQSNLQQRKITIEDQKAATQTQDRTQYAAQIRNSILECHIQIQKALQELNKNSHEPNRKPI